MNGTIRLKEIAHARSGDKGNHANVGVIARTPADFEFLGKVLTEARVAEYFLPLRPTAVERFTLPGISAYNFVLHNVPRIADVEIMCDLLVSMGVDTKRNVLAVPLFNGGKVEYYRLP